MKDNGATLAFEPTHVQIVRISHAIRDRPAKMSAASCCICGNT
jgi:hypothetical protein